MEYAMKSDEKAIVNVSCMGNNYFSPCTTPFTLKLQTYLRMMGIKYDVTSCVMSNKNRKIPFITYNGETIEDTNTIITFLNSEFGKSLNDDLSFDDKARALELRGKMENNLHWALEYERWITNENIASNFPLHGWFMKFGFSMMLRWCMRPTLKADMMKHGVWSENGEEIIKNAAKELSTLSEHLGDQPFFMGKEASEIDATMFGFLAIVYHNMSELPSGSLMMKSLPNLVSYVERMKSTYWPDWDELCSSRPTQSKKKCKGEHSVEYNEKKACVC